MLSKLTPRSWRAVIERGATARERAMSRSIGTSASESAVPNYTLRRATE
jgi:hypothetical protein